MTDQVWFLEATSSYRFLRWSLTFFLRLDLPPHLDHLAPSSLTPPDRTPTGFKMLRSLSRSAVRTLSTLNRGANPVSPPPTWLLVDHSGSWGVNLHCEWRREGADPPTRHGPRSRSPRAHLLLTSCAPRQAAFSATQRSKTTQATGAPQGSKPFHTTGATKEGDDHGTRKVSPRASY